jgi:alpha-tubulin suppressor-like RCC1 family protein
MPRIAPLALVAFTACSALDLFDAEVIDDPRCAQPRVFYRDVDGDGFGESASAVRTCLPPPGYTARGGDCDDRPGAIAIHPGAPEPCDGVDNNCSGDDVPPEDGDGDGHAPIAAACTGGPLPKDDCDDARADVHAGSAEVCDGRDNNCAGGVDEAPAADSACGGPDVRASVCRAGVCVTTCAPDHGDCDRDPGNGCEVDLATSAAHCGACGMACGAGSVCVDGVCQLGITSLATGRAAGTDSAGRVSSHTCVVRGEASGAIAPRVLCWGSNRYGQLGVSPKQFTASRTPVVFELPVGFHDAQLAAGGRGTCVRAAEGFGALWCWGAARRDGVVEAPHRVLDTSDVTQVAMELALDGRDSLCAVTADDRRLRCWGSNISGNLGPGAAFIDEPTEVPLVGPVTMVAMGPAHTCAASEEAVYCWGRNDVGQLGDGSRATHARPSATPSFQAPAGERVLSLVAGRDFSCAVTGAVDRPARTFRCWGANPNNWFRQPTPTPLLVTPVTVATSDGALLDLVANGARWCLGGPLANGPAGEGFQCAGELFYRGNVRVFQALTPVSALLGATHLALGSDHACGLRRAGDVLCWGENATGQCGDGSTSLRRAPVVVTALSHRARIIPSARDFVVLRADATLRSRSASLAALVAPFAARDVALADVGALCLVTRDGDLHCSNFTSALPSTPILSPVTAARPEGTALQQVAMARTTPGAETFVVCVRDAVGAVSCLRPERRASPPPTEPAWSYAPLSPSPTAGLNAVGVAASALGAHFCAWNERAEVWCWGANDDGQVDPSHAGVQRAVATRVEGLDDIVGVAVGPRQACGLRAGGGVVCWGQTRLAAAVGALTNVAGLADAVTVVAGAEHTCALRRSGRVVCWGSNGYGQLGDGSTLDRAAPAEVRGLEDAEDVFAGAEYTCARRRTGQVVCWGRNDEGQLDDGTFDDRNVPTPTSQIP